MKIYLAGYNIDADVIDELKKSHPERQDITPETLSAAYARISRDPRPINELRKDAREEVEKTRKSNEVIIFGLGHSSVAEHAVFNFDIIGASRLAMEEIEKFRLGSYTEKSQRYITLDKDFVLPDEINGTQYEEEFTNLIHKEAELYNKLFDKLKDYVYEQNKELAQDPKNKSLLEGWAKEDARYITSLATSSQVGMTLNTRNLEHLFRRFASHKLKEINNIGEELFSLVDGIAPSIIKYAKANDYDQNKYEKMREFAENLTPQPPAATAPLAGKGSEYVDCQIVDHSEQGDDRLIATMLYVSGCCDYSSALSKAKEMSDDEKMSLIKTVNSDMQLYDSVVREYEYVDFTFDMVVSAACFGQLKRHRLASIVVQDYNPDLGLMIPPAISEIGMADEFTAVAKEGEVLYQKLKDDNNVAAQYALTNAHMRRVLMKVNARELYHISRLREDAHAQWDIRILSEKMVKLAKEKMPLTFAFAGGKDKFKEIFQKAMA